MSSASTLHRSPGIVLMAVFVFLLTAMPKLNVRVGPVPLYIMDLVLLALLYYAIKAPKFSDRPFRFNIGILFGFAVVGEVVGVIATGAVFDHIYIMFRTTLAFLTFFIVGQLVRTPEDIKLLLKAATLGLLITSLLMILTSLPATRATVVNLVLDNRFLEPAGERVASQYLAKDETGARGRTLVGVSILGASFINMTWPLVALMLVWFNPGRVWRNVALLACLLAPLGVLMSYSRGPILGMILIVLISLFMGLRAVRKGVLVPVMAGTVLVALVGVNSELFFFERLTNRTAAVLEAPFEDERESERVLAYLEPFAHVIEKPVFLFAGQGNAVLRSRQFVPEVAGKANHAMFAAAYYSNGMIGAFMYMFLVVHAGFFVLWHVRHRRRKRQEGALYSQALLISLVGMLPWVVFGHAMISQPRGAIMFFFVIGMITTLRHLPMQSPTQVRRERGHYADGRPIAV